MPKKKPQSPQTQGALTPAVVPAASPQDTSQIDNMRAQMQELYGAALGFLMLQDEQKMLAVQETAKELHRAAARLSGDPDEVLDLAFQADYISVFGSLLRATLWSVQGRFHDAKEECREGVRCCIRGLTLLERIVGQPLQDIDDPAARSRASLLGGNVFALRAIEAQCAAEQIVYQAGRPEYIEALRQVVSLWLQAADHLEGTDEMVLALKRNYSQTAGNLKIRVDLFTKEMQAGGSLPYLVPGGDKVFLIHGHDEAKWRELKDLLEDQFNLKAVVLAQEPGGSRPIIQKFQDNAAECNYAIALMTPDDFVRKKDGSYVQARPNVLFELGWFYGRLGPQRVCILKKAGTQLPSDLGGVSEIEFTASVSEVALQLEKELRQLGLIGEPAGKKRLAGPRRSGKKPARTKGDSSR